MSGEAVVSPDGRLVAFTKATPPTDPKPEPNELEKELEARFEGQLYDWMQFRFDRRGYLPDPTDPYRSPPRELYIVAVEGGEPKRLTSLGVDVEDYSWSADSLKLVFTADTHQRDAYVYERADLWIVDLEGQIERLTDDGFHHSAPAFSPDGTRIAYRRLKGLSLVIAEKAKRGAALDIYAMDLAARESVNVTADWALRPGAPTWKSDGRYLYFDAGIGGSRHLFRASASGLESLERVELMVHRYHHQTEWWDEHLSGAAASSQ